MSESPLVSTVAIFFNAEQFIEEAIESVFAQTYDRWELLLVDDGSTDGSTAIARRYTRRYPERVRYLEHDGHANRCQSASRNLGIRHATGQYVAFLDADDVWLPDKLAQQVAILDSRPEASMVYGLSQYWYGWTGKQEDLNRDFVHDLGVPADTLIAPPALITRFFLAQDAAIPSPTDILIRREALDRVGGFEEARLAEYEDQAFYARVCLKEPVLAVDRCWDRYRQHPNSVVAAARRARQEYPNRLVFLNWLACYLAEQGVIDPEVWRALDKELRRCRRPLLGWSSSMRRQTAGRAMEFPALVARHVLSPAIRNWLWARWKGVDYTPPAGRVRFGGLRRVSPLSREYGYDRGLPIDRYYIERFVSESAADVCGHVLEIADDNYTRRFGGDRVTRSDVLDVDAANPNATIVDDLTSALHLPADTFDCIILTQTLQFVYDVRAAIRTLYRTLKPGGVILATIPGIGPIDRYSRERCGHYWSFTSMSAQRLFAEVFPEDGVQIETYGNVLSAAAFLYGMAAGELSQKEMDCRDADFELVIAVRAVKPAKSD